MKKYFVDAAKDLIKGEGLHIVSVRTVADRAGYSFATLYNYFRDVRDLVFECVKDFQQEAAEYITDKTKELPSGKVKLKAIILAYIEYLVLYPGIFDLFYVEKLSDIQSRQKTDELILGFLDRIADTEWEYCIENQLFDRDETIMLKQEILLMTSGMLSLYIRRHYPASYPEFIKMINTHLDRMLTAA